jgi:hypothetical protein
LVTTSDQAPDVNRCGVPEPSAGTVNMLVTRVAPLVRLGVAALNGLSAAIALFWRTP